MNAQVTVETINPKTAAEWLENKWEEQRPIRMGHVSQLSAEMKLGKFRLSTDAIALVKGRLANGQHRLSAVVQSGKPAQFLVMRSSDENLYKIIDAGRPRSISDALPSMSYATTLSSAARLVLAYDFDLINPSGYNMNTREKPITRSLILDYVDKHQVKLLEEAQFVTPLYSKTRIVGVTSATAFLHIASRKDESKARQFITGVYLGESIDASKDFRDRMIRQTGTRSRLRQAYIFGIMVKAWRSFKNGTRPGVLKMVDGEQFPQI